MHITRVYTHIYYICAFNLAFFPLSILLSIPLFHTIPFPFLVKGSPSVSRDDLKLASLSNAHIKDVHSVLVCSVITSTVVNF